MPYLAVLGVGSWSPTRGVRFQPGVYEVDAEIAALAREDAIEGKLLVSDDTPFVISESNGEVYRKPPERKSLRARDVGDPDDPYNLLDPEKEPQLSVALTLEDLKSGSADGVSVQSHHEAPEPPPEADTEPPVLPTGVRYACEFCDVEKPSGPSLARHIEFNHAVTR